MPRNFSRREFLTLFGLGAYAAALLACGATPQATTTGSATSATGRAPAAAKPNAAAQSSGLEARLAPGLSSRKWQVFTADGQNFEWQPLNPNQVYQVQAQGYDTDGWYANLSLENGRFAHVRGDYLTDTKTGKPIWQPEKPVAPMQSNGLKIGSVTDTCISIPDNTRGITTDGQEAILDKGGLVHLVSHTGPLPKGVTEKGYVLIEFGRNQYLFVAHQHNPAGNYSCLK